MVSVTKTHVAKISHSLGGVGAPRAAAGSLCCERLELKSAAEVLMSSLGRRGIIFKTKLWATVSSQRGCLPLSG